jgi:hypothetical protein
MSAKLHLALRNEDELQKKVFGLRKRKREMEKLPSGASLFVFIAEP